MEMLGKMMIYVQGWMKQDSMRFHDATQTAHNLKFMNCLFLEFFI